MLSTTTTTCAIASGQIECETKRLSLQFVCFLLLVLCYTKSRQGSNSLVFCVCFVYFMCVSESLRDFGRVRTSLGTRLNSPTLGHTISDTPILFVTRANSPKRVQTRSNDAEIEQVWVSSCGSEGV